MPLAPWEELIDEGKITVSSAHLRVAFDGLPQLAQALDEEFGRDCGDSFHPGNGRRATAKPKFAHGFERLECFKVEAS